MAKIPVAQEQAAIYVQKDGYTLTQPFGEIGWYEDRDTGLRQCRFPGGQDRFLTPLSSSKVQLIFSMSCTLYLITVNIEEQEKKEEQAQKLLANVKAKISLKDSPLKAVLEHFETSELIKEKKQLETDSEKSVNETVKETKTRYRTDKPIYSRYLRNEKKLITKIYTAIGNAIADEYLR